MQLKNINSIFNCADIKLELQVQYCSHGRCLIYFSHPE